MSRPSYKSRLLLLTREEILMLSWIVLILVLIGFTLGIHLGKQLSGSSEGNPTFKPSRIQTLEEQLPSRQELMDQSKGAQSLIQDVLQKNLHDEVQRSGLRLQSPHPVDLPQTPVNPHAGATTLHPL